LLCVLGVLCGERFRERKGERGSFFAKRVDAYIEVKRIRYGY
jgi:hypothetical protein